MVGPRYKDWHHFGTLYSNVMSRRHQLFGKQCGCSRAQWPFPVGCIEDTKNTEIAIKLSRVVIHVLGDTLLSVPQGGELLVFIFWSRDIKPKWERVRFRKLRRRRVRREWGCGRSEESK